MNPIMVRYIVWEVEMDFGILFASVFLACATVVLFSRMAGGGGEVRSQFVVTGTLLLVFYVVSIVSGICTVFNFLFRWVF
jgi:hypothetical protein